MASWKSGSCPDFSMPWDVSAGVPRRTSLPESLQQAGQCGGRGVPGVRKVLRKVWERLAERREEFGCLHGKIPGLFCFLDM